MRITRETVDELNAILMDVLDDTGTAVRDAAETWLDADNDRDERAEAREVLETEIDTLAGQVADLLKLIAPEYLK